MPSERNRAVFLDRDGVLNKEIGRYVTHLEDFILNENVIESLKLLQKKNFLLIVVSNQGGIAKGICTQEEVEYLHLHLRRKLASQEVELTEIYYCPHHPDQSHCICRKPDSQMLEKAIARFRIDSASSYFIGDAERDMEAGHKAGLITIRVESNQSLLDIAGRIT